MDPEVSAEVTMYYLALALEEMQERKDKVVLRLIFALVIVISMGFQILKIISITFTKDQSIALQGSATQTLAMQ